MEASLSETQTVRPLSGFPTAWGPELDALADVVDCPVSEQHMRDYLETCQHRHCPNEPPQKFGKFKLNARYLFSDREFWIWECQDLVGRVWQLLVGKERSPFVNETQFRIWMIGQHFDTEIDPHDVLLCDFPEYKNSNLKAH